MRMRRLIPFCLMPLAFACASKTTSTPAPGPGTGGPSTPKSSWLVGDNGLMLSIGVSGEIRARSHLTDASFYGLICVDPYTAWVVGGHGSVFYTTDSGAHWLSQASATTADLHAVSFSNAQHGVAVGGSGAVIETDDGGAHWQSVAASSAETRTYRAVALSQSSGAGVAVGDAGLLSWSNDGGRTWVSSDSIGAVSLLGVDVNDDGVAVAVGNGGAAFRIDSGDASPLSWSQLSAKNLSAVRLLPDGNRLIAVGSEGVILYGRLDTVDAKLAATASTEDLYTVAVFGGDTAHYADTAPVSVMAAGANGAIVYAATTESAFESVASHMSATIRSLDALSGD